LNLDVGARADIKTQAVTPDGSIVAVVALGGQKEWGAKSKLERCLT
jgi:hypothetical protein